MKRRLNVGSTAEPDDFTAYSCSSLLAILKSGNASDIMRLRKLFNNWFQERFCGQGEDNWSPNIAHCIERITILTEQILSQNQTQDKAEGVVMICQFLSAIARLSKDDYSCNHTTVDDYLQCCLRNCQKLAHNERIGLIDTCLRFDLMPQPHFVLSSCKVKGKEEFLTLWLNEIARRSLENVSFVVTGVLLQLLKPKRHQASTSMSGDANCKLAIQYLADFCCDLQIRYPKSSACAAVGVLWKELWEYVGDKPTLHGKTLALTLLKHSILTRNATYSSGTTLLLESEYCAVNTVNALVSHLNCVCNDSSSALTLLQRNLVSDDIGCPEMVPLLLLAIGCAHQGDGKTATAAVQLLCSMAPLVVSQQGSDQGNTKSHSSRGIWQSVLATLCTVLIPSMKLPTAAATFAVANDTLYRNSNKKTLALGKLAQHNILVALKGILDHNPFARTFPLHFTADCCAEQIQCELTQIQHGHQAAKEGRDEGQSDAGAFLRHELAFVTMLQTQCLPGVAHILRQSQSRRLAQRTVKVIEHILMTQCCSIDPLLLVNLWSEVIDTESNSVKRLVGSLLRRRFLHSDTLTELAGKVIGDAKVSGKLLDSRTYLALVTFVGILCESEKVEDGDVKEQQKDSGPSPLLCRIADDVLSRFASSCGGDHHNGSTSVEQHNLALLLCLTVLPLDTIRKHESRCLLRDMCEAVVEQGQVATMLVDGDKDGETDEQNSSSGIFLALWLLLIARMFDLDAHYRREEGESRTCALPESTIELLIETIYPSILVNPVVMPASIVLAVRLPNSQQLLFESIGALQDDVFSSPMTLPEEGDACGESDLSVTQQVVHYASLIACVIRENANLLRTTIREQATCTLSATKDTPTPTANSALGVIVDEGCEEVDVDYMAKPHVEEQIAHLQQDALRESVESDDSFLACFVPLFIGMAEDVSLPECVRSAALHTLQEYMQCSYNIHRRCSAMIELLIIEGSASKGSATVSELVDASDSSHLSWNLRADAVLVWMETFTTSASTVSTPVLGLLNALRALYDRCDDNGDAESSFTWRGVLGFVKCTMHCMSRLVRQRKVRQQTEYIAAIAMPLALRSTSNNRSSDFFEGVYHHAESVLLDLFEEDPHLLVHSLFLLCTGMHFTGSAAVNSATIGPQQPSTTEEDSCKTEEGRPRTGESQGEVGSETSRQQIDISDTSMGRRTSLDSGSVSAMAQFLKMIDDSSTAFVHGHPTRVKGTSKGNRHTSMSLLAVVTSLVEIATRDPDLKDKLHEVERGLTDEVLRTSNVFAAEALDLFDVTVESAAALQQAVDMGVTDHFPSHVTSILMKRIASNSASSNGRVTTGSKRSIRKQRGPLKGKPSNTLDEDGSDD